MKKEFLKLSFLTFAYILLIGCNNYPSTVSEEKETSITQKNKIDISQEQSDIGIKKEELRSNSNEEKVDRKNTPFEDLVSFYKAHVAIENKKIFYNEFSNQLRIAKFQIPLEEVEIYYEEIEGVPSITFDCRVGNCLDSNGNIGSGAIVPFDSEESVFHFINLLSRLVEDNS